jgi:hypothetical protein
MSFMVLQEAIAERTNSICRSHPSDGRRFEKTVLRLRELAADLLT